MGYFASHAAAAGLTEGVVTPQLSVESHKKPRPRKPGMDRSLFRSIPFLHQINKSF